MAKAPAFTMTISLSDAAMQSIAVAASGYINDEYDSDVFDAAGVNYEQLINDIKVDPKFQTKIVRIVQNMVNNNSYLLHDAIGNEPVPALVKKARKALDKTFEKEQTEAEAQYEKTLIDNAINRLKAAGYTVSK